MGRLLCGTEIRTASTYWHVRAPGPGVTRIYPDVYAPKVVGMLWTMMAQEQTWFGNEPYKSYGIQLMPLTPIAEQRDDPLWMREMLGPFNASCQVEPNCAADGWSVLMMGGLATIGEWRAAWEGIKQLDHAVYEGVGGNGHSLSNSLWYIATRPDVTLPPMTGTAAEEGGRGA